MIGVHLDPTVPATSFLHPTQRSTVYRPLPSVAAVRGSTQPFITGQPSADHLINRAGLGK